MNYHKMNLNELAQAAHDNAVGKGFYQKPLSVAELIMLVVCELAEAVEADRKCKWLPADDLVKELSLGERFDAFDYENKVKGSVEEELADSFIRLLDLCGSLGLDIESHIIAKMKYNEGRPFMHGKKY
jgi:NTP pyrophosphatase (non-canonical NTP hydrolase)